MPSLLVPIVVLVVRDRLPAPFIQIPAPRSLLPVPYTFLLAPGPIDDFLDPISDLPPFPTVVSPFHIVGFSDRPEHAMHVRRLAAHVSLLRCIESVKEMYGATTCGTRVTFPP